jgi:hypothetical protein
MGPISQFKRWIEGCKERRIERLTAKAADLTGDQQYDLLFLHQRGFVRARGSGQSITKVYADVENLIRKELRVVVTPGTYFVSSAGHQDMATTTEYRFTLYPCSAQHLEINAVCINANRPIPGKNDRFYGVARVSDNVARFLEASRGEDSMVIQAGVWTLTDNYSRYDVINHLISRDNRGSTWHPVTHDHCDRAMAILERLGIPHRLWYTDVFYEKKTVNDNNGSYTGEFRYGRPHGRGKYTSKDGISYEGEWKNGRMNGEGVKVFRNGDRYVGQFDDDREARGWYHYASGGKSWSYRNVNGEWVTSEAPDGARTAPEQDAQGGAGPQAKRQDEEESRRSHSAASRETRDDEWRFCVKCKKSEFWVHTSLQQKRWQAGICPYCEGQLIDRITYWKVYGK